MAFLMNTWYVAAWDHELADGKLLARTILEKPVLLYRGDSGRVVLPGNLEGSRLFRLVGGLENPRMPQGQARITRKNYEDLKKWFEEGNVYDGDDPRTERPLIHKAASRHAPSRRLHSHR